MTKVNKAQQVNKFDHEVFGKLEVVIYESKPHFIANQVASVLGYAKPNNAVNTHCKCMILLNAPFQGIEIPPKGLNIIPEKDVYRLVMRSKLPQAEEFQDWVMEEVLPTIRKTGGFVSEIDQIMDTFYKGESDEVRAIIRAGLVYRKENQHKVDFANDVAEVVNLQDMNSVAKAFGIGRNKMFAKLRELEILMVNNQPYQRYITGGYFEVKQVTKLGNVYNVTMVTGKGEIYLHNKLKEVGVLK